MDVDYKYKVRVGGHTWTGRAGDAATYGPCDGLQIIRKLVETDLWPAPEDVAESRFQVVAAAADDLDLAVGQPAVVEYDTPGSGTLISPQESFYGRVAELTCTPHDLGVVYQVSCLDYKADLRELEVGTVDYPSERLADRLTRVFAEHGWTLAIATFALQPPEDSPMLAARAASPVKLLEYAQKLLDQWPAVYEAPVGVFRGPWRMELSPTLDVNDELAGWRVAPSQASPVYDGMLELVNVGGLWTAQADPDASGVIPAGEVDFGSSYAMTKLDGITRVSVSGDKFAGGQTTINVDNGATPTVAATIEDVELVDTGTAAALAAMYLPPADLGATKWLADAFLWRLELVPDPAGSAWPELPALRDVIAVGGIDATRNPTGNTWYSGLLSGYDFTIVDKRPTYLFTMRRPDFGTTDADDIMRWNSPALVGKTWATLNPADSWDDYRLVKGTT